MLRAVRRTCALTLAALAATFALSPGAGAQEEVAPLMLDGATSFDYPPLRDFELGPGGTLEFWVAALWEDDPGHFPAILALRDPYAGDDEEGRARATRFSIHISAGREEIGMWNGRTWGSVPFDFSDGQYHHVGVVVRSDGTEVFVDGQSRGTLEMGFGIGRRLSLHVGSADGASEFFRGALYSLRLWRAPLTAEDLTELSAAVGPPEPGHRTAGQLVLYSDWSERGQQLRLADGSPLTPVPRAEPVVELAPPDETEVEADITGVWVRSNTRVIEKQQIEGVPDAEHGRYKPYPLYVFEQGELQDLVIAIPPVGPGGGRPFHDEVPAGGRVSELRISAGDFVESLQLVMVDRRGNERALATHGPRKQSGDSHTFELAPGERITGFSGSHDAEGIVSLEIHTDRRRSERFGGEGGSAFGVAPPERAALAAVSGSAGRRLHSLGLDYTGRARKLTLVGDDGTRVELTPRSTNELGAGKSTLTFLSPESFRLDDESYERVPDYLETGDEKVAYGDVFAISNQLYNVEYSFRSYDITRLDPFDFKERGASRFVFNFPDEASRDWYVRNKAIIPNGVEFVTRDRGGTKMSTDTHSSAASFQAALTRSISAQGGVSTPKVSASFSRNESFREMTRRMYENEVSYSFGEARIDAYALVLDKARVKLDPGFRKRVEELANTRDYKGFIEAFGTHYPNAITYGGRGVLRMEFSKESYSKLVEQQVDIKTSAEATLKVLSGGGSYGTTDEVSQDFRNETSSQVDNFQWIGGSAGFGKESWQVGDKVTPIYLDLRALDELLAPPFFTDPTIIGPVRQALGQAIAAYVDSAPEPSSDSVRPATFELVLESLEVGRSGEVDRIAELAGKIELHAFAPGGKQEYAPERAVMWNPGKGEHASVRDGTLHAFGGDREASRRVFAIPEEDVNRGAYMQLTANIVERDDVGAEDAFNEKKLEDLGTKQSSKLYFRAIKPGVREDTLRFHKGSTSVELHYRWSRLE